MSDKNIELIKAIQKTGVCPRDGKVKVTSQEKETKTDTSEGVWVAVSSEAKYGTSCLVCGESVPIFDPYCSPYKICDKCKRAILKMRENMEEQI